MFVLRHVPRIRPSAMSLRAHDDVAATLPERSDDSPRASPRHSVVPWLGLAVVTIVLRGCIADIPLERDEGAYGYVASQWLSGKLPYRDVFDHKPPAIFAAYAVIQAAMGDSPQVLRWATTLHSVGLFVGILIICNAIHIAPHSSLIACLAAAVMMSSTAFDGQSANCELFAIAPATLGFGLALTAASRRQPIRWGIALLAGVCCGLSLLYKHVAILYVLPAFLAVAQKPDRMLLATMFAMGVSLLPAVACGYFCVMAAWPDFVFCNWTYNRFYAGSIPLAHYPAHFFASVRPIVSSAWPTLAAALYGAGVLRCIKDRTTDSRQRRFSLWTWIFTGFLLVLPGGAFYSHYFMFWIPSISVLVAVATHSIFALRHPYRILFAYLAAVFGAYCLVEGPLVWGDRYEATKRIYGDANFFFDAVAWGKWLERHTKQDDTVFIVGSEPQILWQAGRETVGRYCYIYPLTLPSTAMSAQAETVRAWTEQPPNIVVDVNSPLSLSMSRDTPRPFFHWLGETLRSEYRLVALFVRTRNGLVVPWSEQGADAPKIIDDQEDIATTLAMIDEQFAGQAWSYSAVVCASVWQKIPKASPSLD